MDPWTYLTSPTGIELTHAVILVLVAVAAWLSAAARAKAGHVDEKLDRHINGHPPENGPQT